jgi:hypothetical protein
LVAAAAGLMAVVVAAAWMAVGGKGFAAFFLEGEGVRSAEQLPSLSSLSSVTLHLPVSPPPAEMLQQS